MAGKDKGTTGVVSKVDRSPTRPVVFVEGRNLVSCPCWPNHVRKLCHPIVFRRQTILLKS